MYFTASRWLLWVRNTDQMVNNDCKMTHPEWGKRVSHLPRSCGGGKEAPQGVCLEEKIQQSRKNWEAVRLEKVLRAAQPEFQVMQARRGGCSLLTWPECASIWELLLIGEPSGLLHCVVPAYLQIEHILQRRWKSPVLSLNQGKQIG